MLWNTSECGGCHQFETWSAEHMVFFFVIRCKVLELTFGFTLLSLTNQRTQIISHFSLNNFLLESTKNHFYCHVKIIKYSISRSPFWTRVSCRLRLQNEICSVSYQRSLSCFYMKHNFTIICQLCLYACRYLHISSKFAIKFKWVL